MNWLIDSFKQLLLAFQSLALALTDCPVERQKQGSVAGVCSILVYSTNAWSDSRRADTSNVHLAFLVFHVFLLFTATGFYFTLPRRPLIFHDGDPEKPVDNERTVSVVARYTLSWAKPKLSFAISNGGLDFHNLSLLDVRGRTHDLVSRFNQFKVPRLWRHMLQAHRATLASQWLLTLCLSFATFAPQYFLWRLILLLERNAAHPEPIAGLWLALLGFAQLLQPWIETWMLWVGWCHIALPITLQFSGLIVGKTFRRKDIKEVNSKQKESQHTRPDDPDSTKRFVMKYESDLVETEEKAPKRMQDQINLITVDTQRVSDFMSYNSM